MFNTLLKINESNTKKESERRFAQFQKDFAAFEKNQIKHKENVNKELLYGRKYKTN